MIVHFLRAGRTLCGMPDVPANWPDGHFWVGLDEWRGQVTCPACELAMKATQARPIDEVTN